MDTISGMGALPYDGGVAFRVWAPHASQVRVKGTFNDWDASTVLTSEGNGNWYGEAPGAKVGDEYLFVLTNGDNTFDRMDPHARRVTNSVGNCIVYDRHAFDWQSDSFTMPSFNELCIYELHAKSFLDSWGAPLDELQHKLGHFQHLGINAVELMPVMEFAGDLSWGYNPAHQFAVESSYGGPDALKTFVREAHKAGIAVIIDVVYNHFGPSDLATWQFDGWNENGKGGIYFYNDDRSSTPWGDTRPDYGRPEVRQFIHDNVFMWLDEFHADGLRYDMTPYIRSTDGWQTNIPEGYSLMNWINNDVRAYHPGKILIAEDLHGDASMTDPHGAAFHSQWAANFVHPVRQNLEDAWDEDRSVAEVCDAIQQHLGPDPFGRVIYTESHDEDANGSARVNQEVDPNNPQSWLASKRSTLGAALVFTSPGIPMMFQGQEFLQGGFFSDTATLDWHLNEKHQGIVILYQDLIDLRLNREGKTKGLMGGNVDIFHTDDENKVLAYQRWMDGGPGDTTIVVVNLSDTYVQDYELAWPAPGRWELLLNSDSGMYSPDFANTPAHDVDAPAEPQGDRPSHATITIAPYSVQIFGLA